MPVDHPDERDRRVSLFLHFKNISCRYRKRVSTLHLLQRANFSLFNSSSIDYMR